MKKLSLILALFVLLVSFVSCDIYRNTDDLIDDDNADNVDNVVDNVDNTEDNKEDDKQNEEIRTELVTLTLYFPDNDALYLHPEEREVEVQEGQLLAPIVLDELFKGPVSENLSPSLAGEKLVLSVDVSDGLCIVDFAGDFALLNAGGTTRENFVIGSIVNSLCRVDGIEEVKININGNKNATFGGHFTLEAPFVPQVDLIAKQ